MPHTLTSHELDVPGARIAYDVREPATPDSRPPLLMVGQPMAADGFTALAELMTGRTVVTYDPRGLGRSARSDRDVVSGRRAIAWPPTLHVQRAASIWAE